MHVVIKATLCVCVCVCVHAPMHVSVCVCVCVCVHVSVCGDHIPLIKVKEVPGVSWI